MMLQFYDSPSLHNQSSGMITSLLSLPYILLLEHYFTWIQEYHIIINVNINGKVYYFHAHACLVMQQPLISFNALQVHIQLKKLIYGAMYLGYVYDVMDIWIWSRYLIVNIGIEHTIWYYFCIFINKWCSSYIISLVLYNNTPRRHILIFMVICSIWWKFISNRMPCI